MAANGARRKHAVVCHGTATDPCPYKPAPWFLITVTDPGPPPVPIPVRPPFLAGLGLYRADFTRTSDGRCSVPRCRVVGRRSTVGATGAAQCQQNNGCVRLHPQYIFPKDCLDSLHASHQNNDAEFDYLPCEMTAPRRSPSKPLRLLIAQQAHRQHPTQASGARALRGIAVAGVRIPTAACHRTAFQGCGPTRSARMTTGPNIGHDTPNQKPAATTTLRTIPSQSDLEKRICAP
jgi:hypothetical protein